MHRFLRFVILLGFLITTSLGYATRLYWVGGSGNFNDPAHWSLESGGMGGVKSPSASDDVYFDENSFSGLSVISIIGKAEVNDLIFSDQTNPVVLTGTQNEQLIINGNFKANPWVDNKFDGQVWFKSNNPITSVFLSHITFSSNIYFEGNTQWVIQSNISASDNSTVYFNKGTFDLTNVGIYAGNFIAGKFPVTINANTTFFNIKNKFNILNGSTYNDTKTYLRARVNDPAYYSVPAGFQLNSSSKVSSTMSCTITLTSTTNAKCPSGCDGKATFNISAGCSPAPFCFTWTPNGCFCGAPPQSCNVPVGNYTVTNISACAGAYNVSVTDAAGNFIQSLSVPITAPSQFNVFFTTKVKPSCNGKCDGYIRAIVTGGTSPYCVQWTPPGANHCGITGVDTLKNACAGTYTVVIKDANNCVSNSTFTTTLTQPAVITHTVSAVNILCNGQCTGRATDNVSGGTSPFTFVWSPVGGSVSSTPTSSTYTNLCAGTYTAIATDANGCKDTATAIITQPPAITFTKNPASGTLNILCNNVCNGSVGVTNVSGGTGGYTFSWAPAGGTVTNTANSSTYSGLCGSVAGKTYTCTIKDANNCSVTAVFTVKSPPALTHTISATNPKCNTGATGSATVTVGGGAGGPYTFSWSPSGGTVSGVSPKSIYSGIGGGTYTVVSTDVNGCTDTASVTLTPPPPVTGTITTQANPTCPTLSNGKLCVTAGGGTPGYTYSWSPTGGSANCTPATLTVTPGGTSVYSVTVTDANGCSIVVTGTLTSPVQATISPSVTNPSCAGICNGSATLTPTGGTGPFSYNWSCSGSVTSSINGQCGGTTCSYTVTDAGNCKYTGSVSFTVAPVLNVSLSTTTLSCSGNCNAQITSNVTGGTPTYSYAWIGTGANAVVQGVPNQVNMCAGNYTLTVTDALGCSKAATATITAPTSISITLTPTNPTCPGMCNGSILGSISGGTAPYSTSWNPSQLPPGTLNPTSLCAGTYTLNVTDNNGCTKSDTVKLTTPVPVAANVSVTNVTCSGLCNGSATVTASGGTAPYQYNWDNIGFTNSATTSGLCSGTHTVIVRDSKGCTATTIFFNITQPSIVTASVSNFTLTCNGMCNGGTSGSGSGGTPPYQYSWDNGAFSSSNTINTLCVGNHTLTVEDANGCSGTITFSISPLVNIVISSSSTSVSCFNRCDGTASATASGGAVPYTIQWVNANTCTNVVSCTGVNLCAGTQTVIATDANGCSQTSTLTIGNPPPLTAATTTVAAQCFGVCTGAATVTPAGGTSPYSVAWNTGANGNSVSNLCSGNYTATVTDNNGCRDTVRIVIGTSAQFTVSATITPPSTCGASNGSISLSISGGTPGYSVLWNTGSTANPLNNLPAGNYTVTITDSKGCDTTLIYGVPNLTGPTMSIVSQTNATCNGSCNGAATVTAVGTAPITISWPGGPSGPAPQSKSNLCAGAYVVQATDGAGCVSTLTVTITQPTKIVPNATVTPPPCNGGNGSVNVNPTGGSGSGYTYQWSDGSTSNPHSIPAGITYTLVIKDGTGCTATFTYNLTAPQTLSVTVTTNSTVCSYLKNGSASANVTGGTAPFSYTWTNSSGTVIATGTLVSNVSNLPPGAYTVAVSDAGGCSTQATFTINTAPAIIPNFSKTNITCTGICNGSATVAPTGGTGTYTYSWPGVPGSPTAPNVNGLCNGSYKAIITDGNNCKDTISFTLVNPAPLTSTINITNPTCSGLCNGSATVTTSGGTGTTYTVSWAPNVCVNCPVATNLCAGQYTVTSIDSNGCKLPKIITFTTNPALNPNVSDTLPKCVGNCNGIISSAPVGGTGTYSYTWMPAGTAGNVPTASNLCAGSYTLIVKDGNNCKDTVKITLPNPPPLSMSSSAAAATCGQNNGSITISNVVGNGTVTVNWITPTVCGSSLTCNNLGAGIYSVQLTDSKGCKDTFKIAVTNSNGPNVTTAHSNVTCYNACNGTATVTAVSGVNVVTPYVFNWTPPNVSTQGISGLCPGQYISTVTDSLGCKTLTTITITQPTKIQDAPVIVNATCLGLNNGSIKSNGSGGTPGTTGYSYSINGGPFSASNSFTNLAPGSYTVCIKDSLSCVQCFTYTVGSQSQILSTVASTKIKCAGNCNGSATLSNINGGTAPYSIVWNDPNSQTGPIASSLCSGTYTATITDNAGCKALDVVTITAPTPISPNAVTSNPSCGQCNGTITLSPTGGTPGVTTAYTYTWNTGSSSSSISGVCAGVYQVNISDSLGCKQTVQIPVSNSGAPSVTLTPTNPGCSNPCSGSISTTVSGGTTPYTYSWPLGGQTTPSITNQCPNLYFVQVKDALGCISTDSASLVAVKTFTVTTSMTNPPCNANTGSITANVSGGGGPFTYSWSNGATAATNSPIPAGIYTLVVTDSNTGCKQTLTIGLHSNANGPILQVATTNAMCNGMCNGTATVSAFNGTAPYTYLWSPGGQTTSSISNLCPGNYLVQVKDINGCVSVTQASILQPNKLIASLAISSAPQCNGNCNASIHVVVSGGTPAFTYSWNPSSISGTTGTNLCAGTYSVVVKDANGCAISLFDTLVNPPVLSLTGTVTPASCNTVANAAINTTTSGGTPSLTVPGYTYQWSGGSTATTSSLSNILAGNYTVVVTDSKNCKDTVAFVVNAGVTVLTEAGRDTGLCALSSFVLKGVVSGAASVQWIQLPNPPGLVVGNTATVTVTPPSGTTQYVLIGTNGVCVNRDTVSITSNPLPVVDAGPNISIFMGQSGGIGGSPTAPGGGTIIWRPSIGLNDTTASNPVASPTVTTTYSVFVRNSSGCVGMDTVTVTVLPTFIIPNGFSPNGDGYNDVWMIDNIIKFPNCEVEVYNRWGEQLFYSKGYGTPWNGTYQGKPVPVGTYYYVIRLNDPEKKFPDHYTGPLTILR